MPTAPVAGGTHLPAHWPQNFEPQPGDFGALFNTLSKAIGTGGTALTGTATTTVYVGAPASRVFSVVAASGVGQLGFSGSGAITAQLVRINNQGGSPVNQTLTAAQDITTTVFTGTDNCVDFPVTVDRALRTCYPGDSLLYKIVAAGTATSGALVVGCEIAIEQ